MSLQVWLPLNGHIKNYGLSDVTTSLINNPAVVASNRGECYNFNPSNENKQGIEVNIPDMPRWIQNEFSIAFWVYHREGSDRSVIFGNHQYNGSYTFNIEKLANNQLRVYMQAKPDASFSACTIAENTWTHITIVKTSDELYIYKDGTKVATRAHLSSDLWQAADGVKYVLGRDGRENNTALNGMISDFRIYDHILSQKEIKNISQGLLLNYSFDDLYMTATTNLVNKADGSFTKNASSVWHAGLSCPKAYVTPGKTYTFSCEMRHTGTQTYTAYFDTNCTDENGVYSGNDAAMQNIKSNSGTIIPKDGTWVKIWVTVTIKADAGKPYIHHTICPQVTAEEVTFYYRNVQLEEGPMATPYVAYNSPRENCIVDNSGMGRHGRLNTSSCYVSTDTPLGEYSLHLNGSDTGDKACVIGNLNLDDIKTYTFASYIKINTWGKQTSGLFNANYTSSSSPGDYTASPIHHRDSYFDIAAKGNTGATTGATYQRLSCSTSDIPVGQWKHVAVTFDGKTATLYIDGVKKRSVSFSAAVTLSPCKYIFLSYSSAGGAQRVTNANWSDFRVYSTCLSADDIKKLALNHVAVDKGNNLHCYGLVEETDIEHNISKQSVVNAGVKEEVNIYPGSQYNAASMNVTYNFATDIFKDYGFNSCTKFAASNTSTSAFLAYSYLLPISYYTPNSTYSFACYAYVSPDCNANLRINLEQSTSWVKNYQNTKSNINDTTKGQVIKVTGTIKANNNGKIYIMFYPNPNQANTFTTGYFLIAGLTIVPGENIPHPRVEKMSGNLISSMSSGTNMTNNGTHSLIGDFSKNSDTYGWFNTVEPLEFDRMYRLTFNVSNLTDGSIWGWRLWNNANYELKVDRNGNYSYTFIVKQNKLPANVNLQRFLWDDGGRTNPTGTVYFNNFKLVECIGQPHHGIFETNKAAIHPSYIEMNNIYED